MNNRWKTIHDSKIYKKYHQFIRFGLVGATNFLIGIIVYSVALWVFMCFPEGYRSENTIVSMLFRYDYQIANALAFVISVLNAYLWNRIWVFKKEAKTTSPGAVFRFFASYVATFLLSGLLAWLWVDVLRIPKIFVPYLNVLITTPINFLLSKYFAFRKKRNHIEGDELQPFETEDHQTPGQL